MGRDLVGTGGDVQRQEILHGDDGVGHVEVVAGSPQDKDGGDAVVLIQGAHHIDVRCYRLLLLGDEALHAGVPDEEVGGGDVLVDKERTCSHLH